MVCVYTVWYTPHPQRVEVITTLSRACMHLLGMHHSSHCPHLAPLWYITEPPSQAPFLIHPLSPTSLGPQVPILQVLIHLCGFKQQLCLDACQFGISCMDLSPELQIHIQP